MSKKQYFTNARDINKFRRRKRIVTNTKDVQNAVHGRGMNKGTGDNNIMIQGCHGPDGWYGTGCPPGYMATYSYTEQPPGGHMGSVGQRRCDCIPLHHWTAENRSH